jgi:hypothetical protein
VAQPAIRTGQVAGSPDDDDGNDSGSWWGIDGGFPGVEPG